MVNTLREKLDSSHPTLIVRYGNTARKQFVLEQGSTVLGRARGCDVELESPDISSVHCVITRGPEGVRIRDLNSRSGTRLNGDRIRGEYQLRDHDVIQLGPFSFDVSIPGPVIVRKAPEVAPDVQKRLEKLERSRERLAEIALAMRRRLTLERAKQEAAKTDGHDPRQMKEVHRVLSERQQELDQRATKLKDVERGLSGRKTQLDKEGEAFRAQVQRHEHRVAEFAASQRSFDTEREAILRELTELQAHLDRREQEIIRRQASAETELQEAYRELQHACGLNRNTAEVTPSPLAEGEHRLDLRTRELRSFARHLRQLRFDLKNREAELKQGEAQLRASWDRMQRIQQDVEARQNELEQHSRGLAPERDIHGAVAESQRRQLGELVEGLRRLYVEARRRQDAELQTLRDLVERVRRSDSDDTARAPVCFKAAPPAKKKNARPTERIPRELLDRIFNS